MSLFLGKIHYWLFNKILWFEGLEKDIIKLAEEKGLDVNSLRREIEGKYGECTPDKPLEDMIDTNNIHGWLQSTIHSVEGRMAAWTKAILDNNESNLADLEKIYILQGIKAADEVKEERGSLNNAIEIFNALNDYILDGMPCDRVNEMVTSSEDNVEWRRNLCVHRDIWEREGVDVNTFYYLRNIWIRTFVNEANPNFEYIIKENNEFSIVYK